MTRSLKQLLDAAGRVPPDLTFEEFRQMLLLLGWSPVRSFGPGYCRSVWVRGGQLLTIEPTADGGCHARQVRLALDLGF